MNFKSITLLLLSIACLFSCSEEESTIEINNPTTYSFERNGGSTVSFTGQTLRIGMATELVGALQNPSTSEQTLLEMYANQTLAGQDADPYQNSELNASSKSVKSKVAASRDLFSSNTVESAEIKADIENWIVAQAQEVYPNWNVLAAEGIPGQIADGSSVRYINAKGLEYNQAVNKSLIGALMVDQIVNNYLSSAVLDEGENITNNDLGTVEEGQPYTTMEHKWDEAYGYLFGSSTDQSDPLASLREDSFLNKYLARVDNDPDFEGIANEIYQAFKLGRAAIVAGDYSTRDAQVEILKEKIAIVIGVRAVYYLQQGKKSLTSGNKGGAFHDLSEGFGFVYSLRFPTKSNTADPYFSKSEVDNFIGKLTTGNGFWTISSETLDNISEDIAAKFDFTVAEAAE